MCRKITLILMLGIGVLGCQQPSEHTVSQAADTVSQVPQSCTLTLFLEVKGRNFDGDEAWIYKHPVDSLLQEQLDILLRGEPNGTSKSAFTQIKNVPHYAHQKTRVEFQKRVIFSNLEQGIYTVIIHRSVGNFAAVVAGVIDVKSPSETFTITANTPNFVSF